MITAREITAAMRELFPAPVRLSVRADHSATAMAGWFLLRLPRSAATPSADQLAGYLARHLHQQVTVEGTRLVQRRDYGRDIEYSLRVTDAQGLGEEQSC